LSSRTSSITGEKKVRQCLYSPHSLRATSATLLLDSGVPIEAVQDLLDHKHITTTQIYDKRRRSVRDSASHKMPI
jgi:site-specific recombinase XerD